MDEESAKLFLGVGNDTNAPPNAMDQVAPLTRSALSEAEQNIVQSGQEMDRQFVAENVDGAPLDLDSGASPWVRFMLSLRSERANQVSFLQKKYGPDNVRPSSDGGLIIRVQDSETGKPKDVLVDEQNISGKDFIDMIGAVPEVAAGIYALRKGTLAPWMKDFKGFPGAIRDAVTSSVGATMAGGAKDVAVNVFDQGRLGLGDVATERGKDALVDFGIGMVSYPMGRFLKFMGNPLSGSRGKVQFEALDAQDYFKTKYGVDVPMSIGESTGSPLVSRSEVFLEKMPGASTPFANLKSNQEDSLRKLQAIMMGKTPESDEVVGDRLIKAIQSKLGPVDAAVETSAESLAKSATGKIETMIGRLTTPERQLYKSNVGEVVRDAVVAKRDLAKAEADRLYGIVRAAEGGTGKVFPADTLAAEADTILKNLPSKTSTTQTIDYDAYGSPVLKTMKGETVMKEFVPPNILSRLRELSSLKGQTLKLSDLQQMRREVYDDIAKGEGVPGIGTHYLNDIGKAITKAIEQGIDGLPGGDLKSALAAANQHYKKEVLPFNRVGLTEIFRAADEPGNLTGSQIISRVLGGERAVENYGLLKETLGASSPQFAQLKRAIADNVLEASRDVGDNTIDAKTLISNLGKLRFKQPEIADDVFGPMWNNLFKQAQYLVKAQGGKINARDLQKLLTDSNPSAPKLQDLITAEAKQTEAYQTAMFRDIKDGVLKGDLNPEDFINRFVNKGTSAQIGKVMDMINGDPALVGDVRSKMIEKLFRDAARRATPQDISQLISGDPTRIMSGTSLFQQLENPVTRRKLETILGRDTFSDLEQYIRLEAATEAKETSFKAAGGIAAGTQIANLTRQGPLAYLSGASKDFVIANLLTRGPLRKWLTSIPSKETGAMYALLANPEFLKAVTKEFGEGTSAEAFIVGLKESVDKWMGQEASKTDASQMESQHQKRMQRAMEFLKRGQPSLTPVPP